MLVAKQIADLLTVTRGGLSALLIWIGATQGKASLPLAIYLVLLAWLTDYFDGKLARSSRQDPGWVGDHDLQFDILLALCVLIYTIVTGYVMPQVGLTALALIALGFVVWGLRRALGMLVEATIFGGFIYLALREVPQAGRWLVAFCLGAAAFSWKRLLGEQIPAFFSGLQGLWHSLRDGDQER